MPQKEVYETCERLNAGFNVVYSEEGILKFGCLLGSTNTKEIHCEVTNSNNCPVIARLEGKIKNNQ